MVPTSTLSITAVVHRSIFHATIVSTHVPRFSSKKELIHLHRTKLVGFPHTMHHFLAILKFLRVFHKPTPTSTIKINWVARLSTWPLHMETSIVLTFYSTLVLPLTLPTSRVYLLSTRLSLVDSSIVSSCLSLLMRPSIPPMLKSEPRFTMHLFMDTMSLFHFSSILQLMSTLPTSKDAHLSFTRLSLAQKNVLKNWCKKVPSLTLQTLLTNSLLFTLQLPTTRSRSLTFLSLSRPIFLQRQSKARLPLSI
mmetsp:Transcript_3255/g.4766  ORF Transcript_3255/g.4766 Transcript_3255/m.4766 type:complete len:251 (-) Transcript_3255:581-1333(-)